MTQAVSEPATRNPQPATFLTPAQVAERLACGKDLVFDLIHSRQLPAICISKSVRSRKPRFRVKSTDLDTFIVSRALRAVARRAPRRLPYERHV